LIPLPGICELGWIACEKKGGIRNGSPYSLPRIVASLVNAEFVVAVSIRSNYLQTQAF